MPSALPTRPFRPAARSCIFLSCPFSTRLLAPCALLLAFAALLLLPGAARAQQVIGFEEAVDLALQNNYTLRQAANDVDVQSIGVSRNRLEFFPDLGLNIGGRRDFGRTFIQEQGQIANLTSESANFGASTSLNLFNGFLDDATLDQAQYQVDAASRSLRRQREDVIYDVVSRFIELAQNREIVDVQEGNVALREQQLEQTQALIEVGDRPPSDVYQQQAALAEARQMLLNAERNVQLTETEIVRLLALDPFGDYTFEATPIERTAEAELDLQEYDLSELVQQASNRRLDLRAQEASIVADEQGVRAARADYYPRLDLSANYGSNWSSLEERPVPGTDNSRSVPFFEQLDSRRGGSVGFSLSFPIFDRLQRNYNVEQAQVQVENARFQLEALEQDVAVQVRQAYINYQNARTSLDVTEARLQAAQQAQEAAEERYNLGVATFVELAQTNADLVSAASERVRARYDFLLQKKSIEYATGVLDVDAPLAE